MNHAHPQELTPRYLSQDHIYWVILKYCCSLHFPRINLLIAQ
ncbi:Hypothetical protein AJF4211_000070 [Avibacterium paragallinarum JF4211]|nr:Hypothetical protein AJF4211_000070 [Avibacterium paragallinarum JF4211]